MLTAGDAIILVLFIIVVLVWPVMCLWVGFRMGRATVGIVEPVRIFETAKKQKPAPADEDPYYEAMHGRPQSRIATIKEVSDE